MEKIYLEKRFYPQIPIWSVSFVSGLGVSAVFFLTLSFISANIYSLFKISINYHIINFISTPVTCLIVIFSFWYIPARLNSDLSYIKVSDQGVEFSSVNFKLQTITCFIHWADIEIFELLNKGERSTLVRWTHLILKTKGNQRWVIPREPFQTKTDRKDFYYDMKDFIKNYNPKIKIIVNSASKREVFY
jgi:hypothetical protein